MKVLLTGGSGFVGKHCLDSLLKHGFVHLNRVTSNPNKKSDIPS